MSQSHWAEARAIRAPLEYMGVPVIPRFDTRDPQLAPTWAAVRGIVRRLDLHHLGIEILVQELRTQNDDAVAVTIEETDQGIEVTAIPN